MNSTDDTGEGAGRHATRGTQAGAAPGQAGGAAPGQAGGVAPGPAGADGAQGASETPAARPAPSARWRAGPQNERRPGHPRESVWDYPRPPRVEPTTRRLWVVFAGVTIADTRSALRVLETSHPPVYYFPPKDVLRDHLVPSRLRTWCEFKGMAAYFDISVGDRVARDAAWHYPWPAAGYEELAGHIAFYPGKVDACYVDGERVQAQPGDFYGGWITSEIEGPFKGGPGTRGW